jgi:hypothetical protein
MKKVVTFLFALLFAALLGSPAAALEDTATPAERPAAAATAKAPAGKSAHPRKARSTKKSKKRKAAKKGKSAKKGKKAKEGKAAARPPAEPVVPGGKAGTVRRSGPGRFSTPPPGTGYSLELEAPLVPAKR